MKFNFKLIKNIIYGVLIALLIIIAGSAAVSALNLPGGIKLYSVQSGSMEPAILTGSVVVVKPSDNYQKEDIITYKSELERENAKPKSTTTHRIFEVTEEEGETKYITKGDANDAPDGNPVDKGLILGKVILSVPFLGYPITFAKTQMGLILMIIIPSTLIVYSEIMNIKNEAKRLISEKKNKKFTSAEKLEVDFSKDLDNLEEKVNEIIKK